MRKVSPLTRRTLSWLTLLVLLLSTVLTPVSAGASGLASEPAAAAQSAAAQSDLPFFPETGFHIANARFADYFAKRGGLRTFGYPVSRGFLFLGTEVQFFQRQIMQIRPDGGIGTLNILDADLMPYTRINASTFPAASPAVLAGVPDPGSADYAARVIDFVRANTPDTWNGLPVNFGQTFLNTVLYEEAFPDRALGPGIMPTINLELWGVTTSEPAFDPSNTGFAYLRFQRGIMHYDASTGATQGLLLADYLKAILTGENLPLDLDAQARTSRFYRQYDPRRPQYIARPAQLPGTDLTRAFLPTAPGAVEGPPPPLSLQAPPFDPNRLNYGFAVHLWHQDQGRVTRVAREAEFGWLAQQIRWADVERVKGQPDFSELDSMVFHALSARLNVLFSVVSTPTWARADRRTNGPPDNLADYATFVGALASRYRGQVRAYEIWNEQNLAVEWGGGRINAGQYVELLKGAHTAIKAADPGALVVTGALTPTGFTDPNIGVDDLLFLEQMYQYQNGIIRQYSDVVGAHAGGYNNPPEVEPYRAGTPVVGRFRDHPSFYFRRIEQLRDVMVRYGDSQKKLWVTEFGWSTFNPAPGYEYGRDNTEQNQADYLVRAFNLARTRYPWVGVMFVWNLNFPTLPDLPLNDEKRPFGILNPDFSPRPSYLALKAMPK